jgi:Tol biopolymer transport system component
MARVSRRWIEVLALAAAVLLLSSGCVMLRVSVRSDGSQSAETSREPAVSADGAVIAFVSTGPLDGRCDPFVDAVYVHVLATRETTCVSIDSFGVVGSGAHRSPKLSADGRVVVYETEALNVHSCARPGDPGIYYKDRISGLALCMSVATDDRLLGGRKPAISGTGRFVAFQSMGDLPECPVRPAIYVRDVELRRTACVSLATGGAAADGPSEDPSLSHDGTVVAFESRATNLVPGCGGARPSVFVRDLARGVTTCVSVATGGAPGSGSDPRLSADGRFVAFESDDGGLAPDCPRPSIAGILVHDRTTGITACASINDDGVPADGHSFDPVISGDGRFVAFHSMASNLDGPCHSNPLTSLFNVFVHDRATRSTRCINIDPEGFAANGSSRNPALSGNGLLVAFESDGTYLVPGDTNGARDIFVALVALGTSSGFGGGVFVATGDVLPGGGAEVITGTGPGGGPHVRVFGTAAAGTGGFFAYDPAFAGGVRVAACDFDGSGLDEVVTGPGPGGGPHVRVLALGPDGTPTAELASFLAFDPGFAGGVHLACGDVDGDGRADVVVGADAGGGPHVRVFTAAPGAPGGVAEVASFQLAFGLGATFTGGVRVATGNVDGGDRAAIVVGTGVGGGALVRVVKLGPGAGEAQELASFRGFDAGFPGGVFVAAGELIGNGQAQIVVAAGEGGGPEVRLFHGDGRPVQDPESRAPIGFFAYDPAFRGGVHVAVGAVRGAGPSIVTAPGPSGGPHVRVFAGRGEDTGVGFLAY